MVCTLWYHSRAWRRSVVGLLHNGRSKRARRQSCVSTAVLCNFSIFSGCAREFFFGLWHLGQTSVPNFYGGHVYREMPTM